MKRKFTLLFSAVACAVTMNAQVMLNESFTATWNPTGAGWTIQNNSVPQGSVSWFQGVPAVFNANSGAPADYWAVDWESEGPTPAGGISNFLITPTVNLTNGGIISFATKSRGQYPDRMQVLYSYGTGTGAIGAGTTAVGTFTGSITDINAALNPTPNGYPTNWTVYTFTLAGITGTTPGRFAFRYFVNDGGFNGTNSDYVGIDDVMYTFPCAQPTIVLTPTVANICSGSSTSLTATGATNYTWAPGGQTTAIIAVNPSVTTTYTLTGSTLGCPATKTIAVNVTATPTVAALNATTCAGTAATLQASGATSYSWQPGGQVTSSIVVTPTANTVYTVIGTNGSCSSTKTVQVTLSPSLGINIVPTSTVLCSGQSATLQAYGGVSYSWVPGGQITSSIVVSPTVTSGYTVGALSGTCTGGGAITISVNASPSLSVATSASIACTSSSVQLTGSGASSFTWAVGASTAAANPVTLNTGTTSGVISVSLTGQAVNGCTAMTVFSQSVSTCVGLEQNGSIQFAASVYPNPFNGELNVSGFTGNVEIFNTLGQVVIRSAVNENETVNTTSLPKGVYIVKAYDSAGTVIRTVRVIKN